MTSYPVRLHADFVRDLAELPKNLAERILNAVEERLGRSPTQYGEHLRKSLQGFWKMRVGDYRVVFEIMGMHVRVYGVLHRRDRIAGRLSRGWD